MPDVSPNNPCPFLRALVAAGFIDGHIVPLAKLAKTVEAASGEKGLQKSLAGLKVYLVALIANGLSPLRLLRSFWSGAQLDALRDGPSRPTWTRISIAPRVRDVRLTGS